jgi:hypothetical protein
VVLEKLVRWDGQGVGSRRRGAAWSVDGRKERGLARAEQNRVRPRSLTHKASLSALLTARPYTW